MELIRQFIKVIENRLWQLRGEGPAYCAPGKWVMLHKGKGLGPLRNERVPKEIFERYPCLSMEMVNSNKGQIVAIAKFATYNMPYDEAKAIDPYNTIKYTPKPKAKSPTPPSDSDELGESRIARKKRNMKPRTMHHWHVTDVYSLVGDSLPAMDGNLSSTTVGKTKNGRKLLSELKQCKLLRYPRRVNLSNTHMCPPPHPQSHPQ